MSLEREQDTVYKAVQKIRLTPSGYGRIEIGEYDAALEALELSYQKGLK